MFSAESFTRTAVIIDFLQIEDLKKHLLNELNNQRHEIVAAISFSDFKILPSEYSKKMFTVMKSATIIAKLSTLDLVDCKDTMEKWLKSEILKTRTVDQKLQVFVHYTGHKKKWDEWIPWNSPRLGNKNWESER